MIYIVNIPIDVTHVSKRQKVNLTDFLLYLKDPNGTLLSPISLVYANEFNYKATWTKNIIGKWEGRITSNFEASSEDIYFDVISADGTPVTITSGNVDANVNVFTQSASVNVFKQAEFTASSRNESDVTGVTHTVASGKKLALVWFGATGDSPSPMSFRLKVNNVTKMKINLGTGGGGNPSIYAIPVPVDIATEGQTVKITIEPSYKNASGWTGFIGAERDI